MATPTPSGKHPAVSTPSNLAHASSPAPRSVPSPAQALHQRPYQAGKSPFNTSGLSQSHAAHNSSSPAAAAAAAAAGAHNAATTGSLGTEPKTLGKLTGPLSFDSPAAAALGLSLSDMDGGVGMGLSMSGMSGLQHLVGGVGSMPARVDEEDRRRRLEQVVHSLRLKAGQGRVGTDSVTRISMNCGFEYMWESAGERDENKLMIAGKCGLLEVEFKGERVVGVNLSFPNSTSALMNSAADAAAIFKKDLMPPTPTASLTWTLDRFADNLARLSRLDNLSCDSANCYEAVSGIYVSLLSLYEHEKKAAIEALASGQASSDKTKLDKMAEREVLCKKSGRPRLNAQNRVGLSLDYWMSQRHVFRTSDLRIHRKNSAGAMDIDSPPPSTSPAHEDASNEAEHTPNKVYSMTIECEPTPSSLYPSIRVSSSWISPQITTSMPDPALPLDPTNPTTTAAAAAAPSSTIQHTDWLEPPPSYLSKADEQLLAPDADSNTHNADAMTLDDGIGKLPNVRFVAKLHPPVVLPLHEAVQILGSVGVELPPELVKGTTYEGLVLDRPADTGAAAAAAAKDGAGGAVAKGSQFVVVPAGSGNTAGKVATKDWSKISHEYALYIGKTEYAHALEEIPFSHPRQLIEILPILRQHALLAQLLSKPFANVELPAPLSEPASAAASKGSAHEPRFPVDISLVTNPTPQLTAVFPIQAPAVPATSNGAALAKGPKRKRGPLPASDFSTDTGSESESDFDSDSDSDTASDAGSTLSTFLSSEPSAPTPPSSSPPAPSSSTSTSTSTSTAKTIRISALVLRNADIAVPRPSSSGIGLTMGAGADSGAGAAIGSLIAAVEADVEAELSGGVAQGDIQGAEKDTNGSNEKSEGTSGEEKKKMMMEEKAGDGVRAVEKASDEQREKEEERRREVVKEEEEEEQQEEARALGVCEDVGVWVEWVRSRRMRRGVVASSK